MSSILRSLLNRSTPAQQAVAPTPSLRRGLLTELITSRDRLPDDKGVRGNPNYVHLSTLLRDFCPRRRILQERGEAIGDWNPRSADRVLWEIGRAAERHVRNQLIAALNYAGVLGQWSCRCGELRYEGFRSQAVCRRCKDTANVYGELELYEHNLGIVGRPDMVLELDGKLVVLECKSIALKGFNDLQQANADHVIQALSYRGLLASSVSNPAQVHDEVVLLYVAKDYSFQGGVYKEYHVRFDAAQYDAGLSIIGSSALGVKAMRESGQLPPRQAVCTSPDDRMPKNCAACAACFMHD